MSVTDPVVGELKREADGKGRREAKYGGVPATYDEAQYLQNLNEADKAIMQGIYQVILDLNGAQSDIVAGQPKTYIDREAYYRFVTAIADDGKKILSAAQVDILEQVYNWKACGKGKIGVLGAMLRKELKPFFQTTRESLEIKHTGVGLAADLKDDIKAYTDLLRKNNVLAAVISKNAKSFAAQAGINLFTKMHHWDAKNQREWQALFAAVGISEDLSGEDIRGLVYLALHPIPLSVSSAFRKAAAGTDQKIRVENSVEGKGAQDLEVDSKGFVNSVMIRAKAIPAGCATFSVCAAAWNSLSAESYGTRLKEFIKDTGSMSWDDYQHLVRDVQSNGERYHPMAREFGVEHKVLDTSRCKAYMDIAAAYIYEIVKGTLARSAALSKYKDQNTRTIALWQTRFKLEKASDKDSISAFLTAFEKKEQTPAARVEAIRAEGSVQEAINDFVLNNVRSKLKAGQQILELQSSGVDLSAFLPTSERPRGIDPA